MISPAPTAPATSFQYYSDAGIEIARYVQTSQKLLLHSLTAGSALLAKLGEASEEASVDNWDGENSPAVSPRSLKAADDFARTLPAAYMNPDVSIDRDGDVCFDWEISPFRSLTVSIDGSGILSYAGFFGSERHRVSGCETYHDSIPQEILAKLERLFS